VGVDCEIGLECETKSQLCIKTQEFNSKYTTLRLLTSQQSVILINNCKRGNSLLISVYKFIYRFIANS